MERKFIVGEGRLRELIHSDLLWEAYSHAGVDNWPGADFAEENFLADCNAEDFCEVTESELSEYQELLPNHGSCFC